MILVLVVAALALALGVVLGQLGLSYRLARIEGALRNLARGIEEHRMFDSPDVPAEWVINELDTVVAREFHRR